MATNRDALKTYFEPGDRPTANQFEQLIDNTLNVNDDKANDTEAVDASNDIKYITPKKTRTIVDPLLATKEPKITNPSSITIQEEQYWNGKKIFANFGLKVRNTLLDGLTISTAANLTLLTTDSVIEALGKIMALFAKYRLRTQYITLNSDNTLANSANLQKIFNSSTNGAFTLFAGKRYKFKCDFSISGMSSATAGGTFSFGLITTLIDNTDLEILYNSIAVKSSGPAQPLFCSSTSKIAMILVPPTNSTDGAASITGVINCITDGTIAPGIVLSQAVATAKIKKNSYFEIEEIGSSSTLYNGAWS